MTQKWLFAFRYRSDSEVARKVTFPLEKTSHSGVAPANQTKERLVHELFRGAFRNKSSMWIVLVFLRNHTPEFTKKWAKFMNFSFWSFLWFGLPGRLLIHFSENSRRLWLSEIRCWKSFPANLNAAGKFFTDLFSGSTKCFPCQSFGIFRQGKWLLENRASLQERCSSETATAFLSSSEFWVTLITLTPQIWGVKFAPKIGGWIVRKHLFYSTFEHPHPWNLGVKDATPQIWGAWVVRALLPEGEKSLLSQYSQRTQPY